MEKSLKQMHNGYETFREKYTQGDSHIMKSLSTHGQKPEIMVVGCADSRVDPAIILQTEPGDLFITRNVANLVPPYEADSSRHGTSAALEFGVCYLNVKHLVILGHSQCGGISALLNPETLHQNDFISNWVSSLKLENHNKEDAETLAKQALIQSYKNCLTFPWIKERVEANELKIHLWYFNINEGKLYCYNEESKSYEPFGI